jgi:integrase
MEILPVFSFKPSPCKRYLAKNCPKKTNFAEGLRIRIKCKAYEERDIFTNEELTALFHSKEYTEDTFDMPWKFWLPLLGLYTGCRIEELCQLNITDIKKIFGYWI